MAFKIFSWLLFGSMMLALLSCDTIFKSKNRGLDELNKIERQWVDAVEVAGATSRIALSTQINNLQGIRRNLSSIEDSDCLNNAKVSLDMHMDIVIKGLLAFMEQKALDERKLNDESLFHIKRYKEFKNICSK